MFKKVFHIKEKNVETSLIESFYYPKYGPGQLCETLAEILKNNGVKIKKNHNVVKLNKKGNKIISVDCLIAGKVKTIKGDIFVSSMPIKDLINGFEETPSKIKRIASGLPYRDFVTVGLLLKKIDLKNETDVKTTNNIIPDCWIYMQEPNIKLGRIQIFNNWSPYMVKDLNNIWIGLEYFCNENDEFWNLNEEECTKFAIKELISLDIIKEEYVVDSHVEK